MHLFINIDRVQGCVRQKLHTAETLPLKGLQSNTPVRSPTETSGPLPPISQRLPDAQLATRRQ